jgi:hypothetical protein
VTERRQALGNGALPGAILLADDMDQALGHGLMAAIGTGSGRVVGAVRYDRSHEEHATIARWR